MFKLAGFLYDKWNEREEELNKKHLTELLKKRGVDEGIINQCIFAVYDYPKLRDHDRWVMARKLGISQEEFEKNAEANMENLYMLMFSFPNVVNFLIPDKQKALEAHGWALKRMDEFKKQRGIT